MYICISTPFSCFYPFCSSCSHKNFCSNSVTILLSDIPVSFPEHFSRSYSKYVPIFDIFCTYSCSFMPFVFLIYLFILSARSRFPNLSCANCTYTIFYNSSRKSFLKHRKNSMRSHAAIEFFLYKTFISLLHGSRCPQQHILPPSSQAPYALPAQTPDA